MTPGNDDGRPRHRTGPNVENTTTRNEILARQLRQRREAAQRSEPLPDGRRDPFDPTPQRRHRTSTKNVVGITQKPGRALVKGWPALELIEAIGAPREWSRVGRGWVVEARFVPDLLACAESRHVFVAMGEERAA